MKEEKITIAIYRKDWKEMEKMLKHGETHMDWFNNVIKLLKKIKG